MKESKRIQEADWNLEKPLSVYSTPQEQSHSLMGLAVYILPHLEFLLKVGKGDEDGVDGKVHIP